METKDPFVSRKQLRLTLKLRKMAKQDILSWEAKHICGVVTMARCALHQFTEQARQLIRQGARHIR